MTDSPLDLSTERIPFTLIGIPVEDQTAAIEYLETGDICFGKHFAKTAQACIACRSPVLVNGKVLVFRDLCVMKCVGSTNITLNKLTSKQVMERLERGESLASIFAEILGDVHPGVAASQARQVLVDRLVYLKTVGIDPGPVPLTKDLLAEVVAKEPLSVPPPTTVDPEDPL